ncbi:hypothetical protein GIB67_043069 [Kingdonia uniflora]|uniref:Uncharacterized protein n=1 Tax=Kingdonia uniflora TaxID=39325 RepID=A0A7J7MA01_9MAGN|nr:hypothetical protein GIB67_043069 [Kingdonia uniflora]
MDRVCIDVLQEQFLVGKKPEMGWRAFAYTAVKNAMLDHFGLEITTQNIRSRLKTLRARLADIKTLRLIQSTKRLQAYKEKSFPLYQKLYDIMGNEVAEHLVGVQIVFLIEYSRLSTGHGCRFDGPLLLASDLLMFLSALCNSGKIVGIGIEIEIDTGSLRIYGFGQDNDSTSTAPPRVACLGSSQGVFTVAYYPWPFHLEICS